MIPHLYAWKSAKYINEIHFTDHLQLGYWEKRGYSNTADPWKEERFIDKEVQVGEIRVLLLLLYLF